ncbi:unnamed protein product [Rotaria magnacalcarata]|uniref:Uncharacterized protein n=1 Tax=Rotaria magnacalcarata TaxID=392030 RepID=A0A816Y1H6_9BILA|nr:unnamed protein product [Rotaria magnacalcarata]CAF3787416.1 unnamed protein product [Rotaria magnacalcarata]
MPFKDLSYDQTSNEGHSLQEVIHGVAEVELNVFIYNENSYFEKKCCNVTDILSAIETSDNTKCAWIEVIGATEQLNDIVKILGIHFNLHLLTLEDIQTIEERMKIEIFDDGIYLLMKMIYIYEHNQTNIQEQQISFYLKDNILITFQQKYTPFFLPIKQRLANSRWKLSKLKSDYLFYCLVDIIVENYMIVLDRIGLKIEHIEAELMQMKSLKLDTLKLIYNIKHNMLHFRIMCSPLKDIIIKLQKAHDRLPRRDLFAAQRRGPKPMKRKRRRRVTRCASVSILQPIRSGLRSVSPIRANILQPIKSRGRSVSLTRDYSLQPIKQRGRSVSPTRTNIVFSRKLRQSFSSNNVSILHENIFMHLKILHVHILQMNSTIETYSEMISWLVNFYVALNENTVNKAVRLLAMMQAVHYPLLFIHGLNSMSFDWVPQRDEYKNSYFIFLALMILIVLIALTCYKIKKWI